ncbi:putative bifunctional diguanylate cyclase/phosphodiesterase [Marinomonas transparens]|uniref:EAL domain-containing protein n=1 Tax=Marinomonas transparens TaxID=2795388 RepID=A0A934JSG5_9GAMM|nr:EAL domain-containing protein [Marinomonas transparens]MBJ7537471.1 EAL domain-containing protein [Marinomonas transparens]
MIAIFTSFTSRLRFKVLSVALFVACIIGVVGWVGIKLSDTVFSSVSDTTETYLPLLTKTISASNAMYDLTNSSLDLLHACKLADGSHREASENNVMEDFQTMDELSEFLAQLGLQEHQRKLSSSLDESRNAFKDLTHICDVQTLLQTDFSIQFKIATHQAQGLLDDLDGIQKKHIAMLGVTADAWLDRQELVLIELISSSLNHIFQRLKVHPHSSSLVTEGMTVIEHNTEDLENIRRHLVGAERYTFSDGTPLISADVQERFVVFAEQMLSDEGVHDIWQRTMLFYSGTIITRLAINRTGLALSSVLNGVENEARFRYKQARTLTYETLEASRQTLIYITAIPIIVLLIFGMVLSSRLIRPIESLKNFVLALRSSKELDQRMPHYLLSRNDELGTLAFHFDALIFELASARKRLLSESEEKIKTQLDRLSAAFENIPEGLCLTDVNGELLICNQRFTDLYELEEKDVLPGTPFRNILRSCNQRGAVIIPKMPDMEEQSYLLEKQQEGEQGEKKIISVRTAKTTEGGVISVHDDITHRRRQQEQIEHLAYHDTLTKLPNRRLFLDDFNRLLTPSATPKTSIQTTLLFMDLDLFKGVNDVLGHPIGDQLLILVAERLKMNLPEHTHVYRVGGDEFAILVQASFRTAEILALVQTMIDTIRMPYEIDGHRIIIGMSVGIACSPEDGQEASVLMKSADLALYHAKEAGRNQFAFFQPEMEQHTKAKRELEIELRNALDNDDLELAFQPKWGVESGRVEGFEALLRWPHKTRGYISPDEFIPIAEETGLIVRIGAWVLLKACYEASTWPDDIEVSVNVSPVQFLAKSLYDDVTSALSQTGLAPERLELEITEGILMQDTDANLKTLSSIGALGIKIALDDFGTGYSSLGYLRRFHFDRIKIDKSFVSDVLTSKDSQAVVHAVCGICKSLDIESVAEGVEELVQMAFLKQEGCSQLQGYFIARPMTPEAALDFIEASHPHLNNEQEKGR